MAHNLIILWLLRGQALSGEGFTCAAPLPTRLIQAQAGDVHLPGAHADGRHTVRAATCTNCALAGDLVQLESVAEKATRRGCAPQQVASTVP